MIEIRTRNVSDYNLAASLLGVTVAHVKAVAEVESSGSGFDEQGRVKILFEPHKFHAETGGKFAANYPQLSHPYELQKNRESYRRDQYQVFDEACALDRRAAICACSWGRFQILGSHHKALGIATALEFAEQMAASENQQLILFVAFIKANPAMWAALKRSDWAEFARRYNGPGYVVNAYDKKMKAAFLKHGGK